MKLAKFFFNRVLTEPFLGLKGSFAFDQKINLSKIDMSKLFLNFKRIRFHCHQWVLPAGELYFNLALCT